MTPRRGLVWPLLLIAIGLAFLLANFGLIGPVSVVALLSLWPLLLIIIGIDIAVGRRWPLAALAADVLVIAFGIALVVATPGMTTGIFPFYVGGSSGPTVATVDVPRGSVGRTSSTMRCTPLATDQRSARSEAASTSRTGWTL